MIHDIDDVKICIKCESLPEEEAKLEEMAKESGLRVIKRNEWDLDGIFKKDYPSLDKVKGGSK